VTSAAFSPGGRRIATSSDDGTITIWDAAHDWPIKALSGHTDLVDTAAFSPDGRYIVSASDDGTARVWNAHAAPIAVQIGWAEAAQFDPLTSTERDALGLPRPRDLRPWPADRTRCDEVAAAPYDPDRHAAGVTIDSIVVDVATRACARPNGQAAGLDDPRTLYQRGLALWAGGDRADAQRDFAAALNLGYRAAAIDSAELLLQSPANAAALRRAVLLFERVACGSKRGSIQPRHPL